MDPKLLQGIKDYIDKKIAVIVAGINYDKDFNIFNLDFAKEAAEKAWKNVIKINDSK